MKSELAKICQQCQRPTMFTRSKCSVCHLMVCVGCVAWDFMDKTKTEQIVCKDCAKLFTNYKEIIDMDKDRIEVSAYLARQDFSEKEVENLHAGKEIIREGEPEE